jgi:MATE family multidrug resistance protein
MTRQALLIVLCVNVINIIFDILFVPIMGMTANGVALASVIAEFSGLFVGLYLLHRAGISFSWKQIRSTHHQHPTTRPNAFKLHFDFMVRTLLLIACFAFFINQSARVSDEVLAANMVLLNFITLMAYVLDGFANATEVLSGQAVGANSRQMLVDALSYSGIWALLAAVSFSLIYGVWGSAIVALMTSLTSVQDIAQHYLIWVIIAPLVGVWSYLMDGLFVGATLGKEIRNTMIFSTLVCYFPMTFMLQDWGGHGLWAALIIFLAARGLSQGIYLPRLLKRLSA